MAASALHCSSQLTLSALLLILSIQCNSLVFASTHENNFNHNNNILSLRELNLHLSTLSNNNSNNNNTNSNSHVAPERMFKIGFLSQGNYASVQNELHPSAVPAYYSNSSSLHAAVIADEIIAGMVSGTPDQSLIQDLNVFPSEQISVRAMLVNRSTSSIGQEDVNEIVLQVIDAALVRVIAAGGVEQCAANNPPYQALVVHSCKPSAGNKNSN